MKMIKSSVLESILKAGKPKGDFLHLLLELWRGKNKQLIPIPIPVKQGGIRK